MSHRAAGWSGVLLAAFVGGCSASASDPYRFEASPRTVAAMTGFTPSRYARGAVDPVSSGTVYLLTLLGEGDEQRLALLASENGGDSFGAPVPVSAPGARISSHGEDAPSLIAGPQIYAAWNEAHGIRVARSVTWGESFDPPISVSDAPESAFSGYVSIGVAPNADLYVVWLDTRDGTTDADTVSVYLARSTDRGASFGKNIRVATGVCPCCRPNLSFGPNGELMVFWRKVFPGQIRDMVVAVSRDQGQTFSEPRKIAEDGWRLEGCPDSGITVVRVGTRVYGAWLTEASPDTRGIRFSWSDDGGVTWVPAARGSQDVLDANYPALAATGDGGAALIFQGRDATDNNGWGPTRPFLVRIDEQGRRSRPMVIPGVNPPISRPSVFAGSGGRLYTTWTGSADDAQAVFVSRARR